MPRNRTSRTEPTADTTTANFTSAAAAKSTIRAWRLSPGAIFTMKRRPCSTSLYQSPSMSPSRGAAQRRLEPRDDGVVERAAVGHPDPSRRDPLRAQHLVDPRADQVLELLLDRGLDLHDEGVGGLDV